MPVPGEVKNPTLLDTRNLTFVSDGARINGYLARPRGDGPFASVIVIHEAFGLNEHIQGLARRFANAGFIALAPDLYSRSAVQRRATSQDLIAKMISLLDLTQVHDLEAAAKVLRQERGSNGKVGSIGFCSGGRATLLFACSSEQVDPAIDCWGGSTRTAWQDTKSTAERPTPFMELTPNLACPLFVVIGEVDGDPSPDHGREFESRAHESSRTGRRSCHEHCHRKRAARQRGQTKAYPQPESPKFMPPPPRSSS